MFTGTLIEIGFYFVEIIDTKGEKIGQLRLINRDEILDMEIDKNEQAERTTNNLSTLYSKIKEYLYIEILKS